MASRWPETYEGVQVIWEGSMLHTPSHHFSVDPHFLVRVTSFALPDPQRIWRKMPRLRDDPGHLMYISRQLKEGAALQQAGRDRVPAPVLCMATRLARRMSSDILKLND
jgi:hypothetical protein